MKCLYKADGSEMSVLLVDLEQDDRSLLAGADEIYAVDAVDLICLRHVWGSALEAGHYSPLIKRAPNASFRSLSTDGHRHIMSAELNAKASASIAGNIGDEFLGWLRCEEMKALAGASSAVFQANPPHLFRLPSRRLAPIFFRAGNVQSTIRALDALAFWLVPFADGAGAVVIDTWSISSTALRLMQLLRDMRPNGRPAPRLYVLPSYMDGTPECEDAAKAALSGIGQVQEVLLIMSAIATGDSLPRIIAMLTQLGVEEKSIKPIAMYDIGASRGSTTSLCHMALLPKPSATGATAYNLNEGEHVFTIDSRTYFPAQVKEHLVRITKPDAAKSLDFMNAFSGSGCITVHRDVKDDAGRAPRHHSVDLDVGKMCRLKEFKEKLTAEIQRVGRDASLVVLPAHAAGDQMLDIAAGVYRGWGKTMPLVSRHPDLGLEADDPLRATIMQLGSNSRLLIIDDVATSGSRLSEYQRNLRNLGYPGFIEYIVGVARPANWREWKTQKDHLEWRPDKQRNGVHALFEILLPNAQQCPWCAEAELLRTIALSESIDQTIKDAAARRRACLDAGKTDGLSGAVFWKLNPAQTPFKLAEGSLFVHRTDASEADVVCAVAATIQGLRDPDNDMGLEPKYPRAPIIDPTDYFGSSGFSEPVLRSSILRMVKRSEIAPWTDASRETQSRMLTALIEAGPLPEAAEICLATMLGKVAPVELVGAASHPEWAQLWAYTYARTAT